MRLCQHPLMSCRGRPTWPPEWTWVSGSYDKHPEGEAGVLENVRLSAVNDHFLFLTMSYGGDRYVAELSFDDSRFCQRVFDLLEQHYSSSIKAIGNLEIS